MQGNPPFLKKFLPKSLFGRALLILLVPILVLQAVVTSVVVMRHYDSVTVQMVEPLARALEIAAEQVESAETTVDAHRAVATAAPLVGTSLELIEGADVRPGVTRAFYDISGAAIGETLTEDIDRAVALDLVSFGRLSEIRVATTKGALQLLVPRRRLSPTTPYQLLVWTGSAAILVTVIAVIFLRNQVKPINELARAATAFGRGRFFAFRPSGAVEVRTASAAFIDMRSRIERQIEQRTSMLSGVSHDLRTPLTRIKLALAVAEETPETREIGRDVDEMERMLDAFLDFARGQGGEAPMPVDPVELAEEVAADARRKGADITLYAQVETPDRREVELRRQAVKRCLTNLVDNASTYGAQVALSTTLTARFLEFAVEDDGPGIPPEKREDVLRPFTRLDAARNQNVASGVGLGLSIAQDIARTHGGSLALDASPRFGGLRATVMLPR